MPESSRLRRLPTALITTTVLIAAAAFASPNAAVALTCAEVQPATCPEIVIGGSEHALALPCSKPLADYQAELYLWLNERRYAELGWPRDEHVRDTGPFILGENYGTHPAVRVHYSPEVARWIEGGRQGELPVGSMIIKEMFLPPAARLEEQRSDFEDPADWEALVAASVSSWAVMIRDCQTFDGWFWAGDGRSSAVGLTEAEFAAAVAGTVDSNDYPFNFRDSDYGLAPCLRCHAVAESESTFSSIENLESDGLRFRVDASWRTPPAEPSQLTPVGGQLIYLNPIVAEQALPPEQRPAGGEGEASLISSAMHGNSSAGNATPDGDELLSQPLASPSAAFTEFFKLGGHSGGGDLTTADFRSFPGQWADHVPAGPAGAEQFITADNCLGCHGGLGGAPYGVSMFVQTGANYGDGYNISPFGEWRWSPMGLAGRDPIFYSQLATEKAILDLNYEEDPGRFNNDPKFLRQVKSALEDTCLSCHGAMGQRQLLIDHVAGTAPPDPNFKPEYVYVHTAMTEAQLEQENYEYHKYGNLAREGISCTVCHHIDPPTQWRDGLGENEKEELFLMHSTTGQFPYSAPDELNGPFKDVIELPMMQALRITPEFNEYIQDSRMCGTCHTINLPNVDCGWQSVPDTAKSCRGDDCPKRCEPMPVLDRSARQQADAIQQQYGVDYAKLLADNFPHSIEQATYLEWKNSVFADPQSAEFQSCQDCHMPRSFKSLDGSIDIDPLHSQIATIQDSAYPQAENSLPNEEVYVPVRPDYSRHELVGLNVFLVEMFDQFEPILGLAETDPMTSATTGDKLAIENMVRQGRQLTATIDVDIERAEGRRLVADVIVESLTGHRFPSGVGFRRAWIELQVLDNRSGERLWASGLTNDVGLIVGPDGEPLPTEFFEGEKWQRWQPHFHGIPDQSCRPCKTASGVAGCRAAQGSCAELPPPITRQDQVQIYEEVTLNGKDEVTFSFIHRDEHPKDNRFLPKGWRPWQDFEGEVMQQFMEATTPEGVGADPDYTRGRTGQDRVRYQIELPEGTDASEVTVAASLYSQSFQPYWFKRKFELSGDAQATKRLYYLASRLNTQGTVIDSWKLRLLTCTKSSDGTVVGPGCAVEPGAPEQAPSPRMAAAH